jgi:hypothetical protein
LPWHWIPAPALTNAARSTPKRPNVVDCLWARAAGVVSSVRLPLSLPSSSPSASGPSHHPQNARCLPRSLRSWHRLPYRYSMAHDASASTACRRQSPVRLNKAPCPRSGGIPASPLHSLARFTAPPAYLPHILPRSHLVSCAYPPTPIAAPWYPREPHYSAPTRSLPTSHPNHRPTVSHTPSPSQPTHTQRLLRCTAATCDPLRRLIDPPCVTCSSPGIITTIAAIHLDRLVALPEKP